MGKSYNKPCIYCEETIEMSDRQGGKWLPFNQNGSVHDCRKQKGHTVNKIEPLSIEARIQRLERIVLDPRT